MTLRLRINIIVGTLTLLFVAGLLAQQLGEMRQAVHEEVVAANRVAAQLLNRLMWGYAARGPTALTAALRDLGRVRSNEITLTDRQGQVLYRSPPPVYKAGRDAPAWFEHLVSPEPSVQAIELPDGKLEIRANAGRAALDAWEEFSRLLMVSLALVAAANALVFWLVGRAVRPFSRIVEALDGLQAGRFDVVLPRLPGTEAQAIGEAYNRMVGVVRHTIESERRAALAEARLTDSRELARWVDGQLEDERRHIARELHDELGQSVTAMRSMALSIAQRVGGRDAESEQAARVIADESSRLYDAMHGLIPRLAPLVLDRLGLEEGLRDLAERTRRAHPDVRMELQAELHDAEPSAEVAITLYRAVQEGITNALRHGHAQAVRVRVARDAAGLSLEVVDDGQGLDGGTAAPGHFGLRWLAERVESVGGQMTLEPVTPHGARLAVHVPLQATAPRAEATA